MQETPILNTQAVTHEFVLVLSGVSDLDDTMMNALFEAGCDDATPSLRFGRIMLTFAREAPSFKDAIFSAIRDVLAAGVGATVLSIDACNLVTQADIARRIDRSRQMVGQYLSGERGPGGFPGPVGGITDKHPLWMWSEVVEWLHENRLVDDEVRSQARTIATINGVLDYQHQKGHDAALVAEVLAMFAPEP